MSLTADQMTSRINASVFVFVALFFLFSFVGPLIFYLFFSLHHPFPRTIAVLGNTIINASGFTSAAEHTFPPLFPPSNQSQTVICFATCK